MFDWRSLNDADRAEFNAWVSGELQIRAAHGKESYGDRFQGDPLKHLKEELLDELVYLYYAMREREWLRERIAQLSEPASVDPSFIVNCQHSGHCPNKANRIVVSHWVHGTAMFCRRVLLCEQHYLAWDKDPDGDPGCAGCVTAGGGVQPPPF